MLGMSNISITKIIIDYSIFTRCLNDQKFKGRKNPWFSAKMAVYQNAFSIDIQAAGTYIIQKAINKFQTETVGVDLQRPQATDISTHLLQ